MAQTKAKTTTVKKTPAKKSAVKKAPQKKEMKIVEVKKSPVKKNDTFAVIAISGTQLKVRVGDRYEIEKIEGKIGEKIEIKEVLLISNGEKITVGKPFVKDAKVVLSIDSQLRGEKIEGFKYKAKSRYRRKYGYRAELTRVTVKSIG
jgi:large subunit ribosomal protein L21